MKKMTKTFAVLLALVLALSLSTGVFAASSQAQQFAQTTSQNAMAWLEQNLEIDNETPDNRVDWANFVYARAGYEAKNDYLAFAESIVKGNFDNFYASDIARIALAVEANGGDATNIGSKDLIEFLKSYKNFASDNLTNSVAYALLALNCRDFGGVEEAKQNLVSILLNAQRDDGGYSYTIVAGDYDYEDVDSTAAVVTALSPYYNTDENVKACIDVALDYISTHQTESGLFASFGNITDSVETTSMVIIALCSLGIDPTSTQWLKGDKNMIEALANNVDKTGGIITTCYGPAPDYESYESTDVLATYQVVMGLQAFLRLENGKTSLYDFSDEKKQAVIADGDGIVTISGLLSEGASVSVRKLDSESEDYKALSVKAGNDTVIVCYDITVTGTFDGKLSVSITVGEQYNGQKLNIYHKLANGEIEIFKDAVVANGKVTVEVTELSPFMITVPATVTEPESTPKNPVISNTGDSSVIGLSVAAVACLGAVALLKKKEN